MPSSATGRDGSGGTARGYVRVAELASGGMGAVELVVRSEGTFQRLYARKRLHPHLRGDAELRAMFMDEGRVAGLLRHPNVVSVIDVGEDEQGPFLVMDFVDGVPASTLIARAAEFGEPFPVQLAVRIALDVARGLEAAHELRGSDGSSLGLVHRDVSPHNVLLGFDGSVRVSDFGIAKALGNTARTSTGILKGNVGYLSPEQLRFEAADRRSDLFALGVVLFELLAGRRLYAGEDARAIATRVLHEPPADVGELRTDVEPELNELLFELLAKQPDARPATAGAVAQRLERVLARRIDEEGALGLGDWLEERFGDERRRRADERAVAVREAIASASVPTRRRPPPVAIAAVAVFAVVSAAALAWRARSPASVVPGATRTVWAGGWHTCALLPDARLACWGKNNEGQLGDGTTSDNTVRRDVVGLDRVVDVAMGQFHTCACRADGAVFCWGRNAEGQLGSGDATTSLVPRRVPGIEACRSVGAGARHSCVVERDGGVLCWGDAAAGQTGQSSRTATRRPARVQGVTSAVEVRAGDAFTCARSADATVTCWGGEGAPAPRPVAGVTDAAELVATAGGACVRRRSGSVACWGRAIVEHPDRGEPLGVPTTIPGVDDAAQLAAGLVHVCALRATGVVVCAGGNHNAQLGDGGYAPVRAAFAPVLSELRFLSVAAGLVHGCARHARGIACWGRNETGQLGDGTSEDRTRPVSVVGFSR